MTETSYAEPLAGSERDLGANMILAECVHCGLDIWRSLVEPIWDHYDSDERECAVVEEDPVAEAAEA